MRCSSLLLILLALFWTLSSSSYTGELSTGHHSTCGLSAELKAGITSLCLLQHSQCRHHSPSSQKGPIVGSCSTCCPPEPPGSFFCKAVFHLVRIYWCLGLLLEVQGFAPAVCHWVPDSPQGFASPVLSCTLSLTQKTLNVKWQLQNHRDSNLTTIFICIAD